MRRLLRRRLVVALLVLAVLGGTGTAVYARTSTTTPVQYRTSAAALGTVTQTLSLSGNLTPVDETDLDFGSSGRVQSVSVIAGQAVTAGQVLATLDPAALQGALLQAQANLQSSQAKLSLDQAGPTAQSLATSQGQVRTAQAQVASTSTAYSDTQASNQQALVQAQSALSAAQATVISDQATLASDQSKQQADESRVNADCPAQPACSQEQSTLSTDNQRLATDQQAVAKDAGAIGTAQGNLSAAAVKNQQSLHQAAAAVTSASVGLQNAQASLAALQQTITPQQILQDQAGVAIAQVNVDSAQRAVTQSTIVASVAGTVAAVNITVGQTASGSGGGSTGSTTSTGSSSGASTGSSGGSSTGSGSSSTTSAGSSSTTHSIVVLTPGAFAVVGTVSDAQINQVAIGQRARITPAGSTQASTGKVTAISPQATVTSGVATFAVTVTLDEIDPSLHSGTSASISIIVNQVVQVLTVPTSAVSGGGSVQVMVNGKPEARTVQVGATDALRTQVLSGVNPGDQVAVATVTGTIPTTTNGNGGGNTRGGPGGGGGGGGGAGGAARALGG